MIYKIDVKIKFFYIGNLETHINSPNSDNYRGMVFSVTTVDTGNNQIPVSKFEKPPPLKYLQSLIQKVLT